MKNFVIFLILIVLIGAGLAYYFFYQKSAHSLAQTDLIKIETPRKNEKIKSPYVVSGQARGFWFFEASFPVKLIDQNGQVLAQTTAQARGDWLTQNFVSFEATLDFSVVKGQKATIVLEKDNPSGLPENAAEIRIPVILGY
jgi:hypothetical protein